MFRVPNKYQVVEPGKGISTFFQFFKPAGDGPAEFYRRKFHGNQI